MARSTTSVPAIEKKALAEPVKSEGMRILLNDGYTVAETAHVFGSPYGFVYGVASRAGLAETAANRRAPRKVTTKAAARVSRAAKPAAKVTRTQFVKPASGPRIAPVKARATKPSTASKAPGRPSPARRAANRKSPQRA